MNPLKTDLHCFEAKPAMGPLSQAHLALDFINYTVENEGKLWLLTRKECYPWACMYPSSDKLPASTETNNLDI